MSLFKNKKDLDFYNPDDGTQEEVSFDSYGKDDAVNNNVVVENEKDYYNDSEPDYSDFGGSIDIPEEYSKKVFSLNRKILIPGVCVVAGFFLIILFILLFGGNKNNVEVSNSNILYAGDEIEFIPQLKKSMINSNSIYIFSSSDSSVADFEYQTLSSNRAHNTIVAKKSGNVSLSFNVLDAERGKKVGRYSDNYVVCKTFNNNSFSSDGYSLTNGDKLELNLDLSSNDLCYKNLKYSSSNENVFKVSSKGVITGVNSGTAVITVNNGFKDIETFVKVISNNKYSQVESVKLNTNSLKVGVGKVGYLTATIAPEDATNKSVEWSSSNEDVATVSSKGEVTGVKTGTAVITVTTQDVQKDAMVKVTVISSSDNSNVGDSTNGNYVKVNGIKLNYGSLSIYKNNYKYLTATISPSNATNKGVKWNTSNSSVAIVSSSGKVTGVGIGSAVITATSSNGGYKASCKVTVTGLKVKSVNFYKSIIFVSPGSTTSVKYSVSPSNATNKSLRWSSSNTSVARVNSNGIVTGVKTGTATITGTAIYGSGSDKVTVQVGNDNLVVPTITASDGISSGKWHKNNITLTASSSDTGITYKWNTGSTSSSISLSNETSGTTYTVKACKSNVCSSSRSYFVKLDKTKPSCSIFMKTSSGSTYANNTWTKYPITLSYSCSDSLSGMSSYNGRNSTNSSTTSYPSSTSVYIPNTATVTITKKDLAGNVYTFSKVVKVDVLPPYISSGQISSTAGTAKMTFNVIAKDSQSGVKTVKIYYTNQVTKKSYTKTYSYTSGASSRTIKYSFTSTKGHYYKWYVIITDAVGYPRTFGTYTTKKVS